MTSQPLIPNPSVDQRLLDNLRHARLEMEELGLQFDEVLARLDKEIHQQKLKRIQGDEGDSVTLDDGYFPIEKTLSCADKKVLQTTQI